MSFPLTFAAVFGVVAVRGFASTRRSGPALSIRGWRFVAGALIVVAAIATYGHWVGAVFGGILAQDAWRRSPHMIHQLRIYEIFEHSKAAFHDRFRDHAARIMKTYGFEFVAMWEARTERRTEFVYLLAWPNEATKTTAWARFMADEEWKEIKRVTSAKHGDLVGAIEDRVLVATAYSPSRA